MSPGHPFPSALLDFLALYAEGHYWESHEVLEGPWREGRSEFYHGLILLASAFVHVQRGNPRGVRAQLAKARRRLEPYRPWYLGFDVEAILARVAELQVLATRTTGLEPPPLVPDVAHLRGDEPELTLP